MRLGWETHRKILMYSVPNDFKCATISFRRLVSRAEVVRKGSTFSWSSKNRSNGVKSRNQELGRPPLASVSRRWQLFSDRRLWYKPPINDRTTCGGPRWKRSGWSSPNSPVRRVFSYARRMSRRCPVDCWRYAVQESTHTKMLSPKIQRWN